MFAQIFFQPQYLKTEELPRFEDADRTSCPIL